MTTPRGSEEWRCQKYFNCLRILVRTILISSVKRSTSETETVAIELRSDCHCYLYWQGETGSARAQVRPCRIFHNLPQRTVRMEGRFVKLCEAYFQLQRTHTWRLSTRCNRRRTICTRMNDRVYNYNLFFLYFISTLRQIVPLTLFRTRRTLSRVENRLQEKSSRVPVPVFKTVVPLPGLIPYKGK